jgi:hypothetical protein
VNKYKDAGEALALSDGELQSSVVRGWILAALINCDRIHQMIQSAAQIVDTVGSNQRPPFQCGELQHSKDETVAATAGVFFLDDRVRVALRPRDNFILAKTWRVLQPAGSSPTRSR